MRGRVLVIAGSDSGGGAGIQADVKTITMLGGYASTAITALTAQDTTAVHAVLPVPPAFVALQMRVVLDDIGADAIKTGMLGTADVIEAVAATLPEGVPVVIDPVMVATSGARLLDEQAVRTLRHRLIPRAALLTPNIPEAEALCDMRIESAAEIEAAIAMLLGMGARAVLLKGGHLPGVMVTDVLGAGGTIEGFAGPRIATGSTHGTGCTLASAIATALAQGVSLRESVSRARAFVRLAMERAPGLGHGHGPLGHAAARDDKILPN